MYVFLNKWSMDNILYYIYYNDYNIKKKNKGFKYELLKINNERKKGR